MLVGTGPDRRGGGSRAGRRGGPGSRPGPAVFMLAAAAALVLGAAACSSGSPAGSPAPASGTPAPAAGSCAWPTLISAQIYNNVVPDAAASVWVQPIVVHKNLRIVISGRYPDARYASFSVYTSGGSSFTSNGAGSSLPDYRIAPDRGRVHPRQHVATPVAGSQVEVPDHADLGWCQAGGSVFRGWALDRGGVEAAASGVFDQAIGVAAGLDDRGVRSEEHTSE